jgi:hypothetical protein
MQSEASNRLDKTAKLIKMLLPLMWIRFVSAKNKEIIFKQLI